MGWETHEFELNFFNPRVEFGLNVFNPRVEFGLNIFNPWVWAELFQPTMGWVGLHLDYFCEIIIMVPQAKIMQ